MTEHWRHNKAASHGRMPPIALKSLVTLVLVWLHRARNRRELSQLDDMQMRDAGINAEMLRREAEKDRGRVARPFGFALTDPGMRISRTRLFPEVIRIRPLLVSRGE